MTTYERPCVETYQVSMQSLVFITTLLFKEGKERPSNILEKCICDIYNMAGIFNVDAARLQMFINTYTVSDVNE